jgi:acyl-CoA dehydrogenase
MGWDFETDPEFQRELEWVDEFVRREVEPLEYVLGSHFDVHNPERNRRVRPLQEEVKRRGLWACHLGPNLGGRGFGQLKLALLNEILGRASYGPTVFGCQAPDSGNAEILAHYGTADQKRKYLQPLLENEIVSCFAMTEPQGGADPSVFATTARATQNGWVLNGSKWFVSNARFASFYIVMAVTDPAAPLHQRMSAFIIPAESPGIEIIREVGVAQEPEATHAYVQFTDVSIDDAQLLGTQGEGFMVAQTRLGGGRIHHAMRVVGMARKALDMMCERVQSRHIGGGLLADKQLVQEQIADSWIELEQFRLLVLRTAWLIDKHNDYRKVLKDISAVKAVMPKVLHDIAARALHIHGSLGVSHEMPFAHQIIWSYALGLADGPTEVHKITVAKRHLKGYRGSEEIFPEYERSVARARAQEKFDRHDRNGDADGD